MRRGAPSALVSIAGLLVACGLLLPGVAAADELTDLFQKAKVQFRDGTYEKSLDTLKLLDEVGRLPRYAQLRPKLEPALAFYRGANLAALGRKDEARVEFEKYLGLVPNANVDPAAYPKAVIEAFKKAQQKAAPVQGVDAGMAREYARFFPEEAEAPSAFPDERWAEGAIRYIMSREEKAAWKGLQSTAERVEFVHRFWERRDPALRGEIDRRIRFADARFKVKETRGSETDRGLVFVLLGPPSYVGQSPLKSEDDTLQPSRNAPSVETTRNPDGSTSTRIVPRLPLSAEALQGSRETWHYRRDRLPKEVGFGEVTFEFVTKEGAGTAILQRDHTVLSTLDAVANTMLPKG